MKVLFEPMGFHIDLVRGVMEDPDNHIQRRASSMHGYYSDEATLAALIALNDPLHYEVFEKAIPEEYGHLRVCISKLQPGDVGGECFMTKGHYHTVAGTAESYLGLTGEGYLLMKTEDGRCVAEPIMRGRLVYVPPHWAHRSINTGDEPLISLCVYPGEAGHNYGDILEQGFPKRVYRSQGRIEIR